MVLTHGHDLQLGMLAPDFDLPDTNPPGKHVSLGMYAGGRGLVVMFLCNHCPYVIHLQDAIVAVANRYQPQGIKFVAISSNDIVTYPQDAPDKMTEVAREKHYPFPYLYDASQQVAKAYGAVCTPEFFVFDDHKRCVYHGRFDAASPGNSSPVTGEELCLALDALLDGKPILETQQPSIGCSIKWLQGT